MPLKEESDHLDTEYSDLNQVLQQNLNINNVQLDGEGAVTDFNAN